MPLPRASSLVTVTLLVFVAASMVFAQTATNAPAAKPAPAGTLTVQDIVKMSKAGLDDEVIVQQIKKNGQAFDLTTDQLIELKSNSVSNRVIQVMQDPLKADIPSAPAITKNSSGDDSGLPAEVGVYAKKKGEWVEVMPEVVNWKTGGVMKSVATAGVVKGDVNGHLNGKHSHNSVTLPTEFLIVLREGDAITEFQLLHLRENGSNREFRTVTGGVFHVSGGATRDLMTYDSKKVGKRQYSVTLGTQTEKGEYGFLPPGAVTDRNAAASAGKLYSFEVVE